MVKKRHTMLLYKIHFFISKNRNADNERKLHLINGPDNAWQVFIEQQSFKVNYWIWSAATTSNVIRILIISHSWWV